MSERLIRSATSLFALLVLLSLSACTRAEQLVSSESGEEIYELRCASCHGLNGAGDTPTASGFPNANLIDQTWGRGSSKEDIVRSISEGSPGTPMLAYKGILTQDEIEKVAAHVQSLSR